MIWWWSYTSQDILDKVLLHLVYDLADEFAILISINLRERFTFTDVPLRWRNRGDDGFRLMEEREWVPSRTFHQIWAWEWLDKMRGTDESPCSFPHWYWFSLLINLVENAWNLSFCLFSPCADCRSFNSVMSWCPIIHLHLHYPRQQSRFIAKIVLHFSELSGVKWNSFSQFSFISVT